ncbi:Retrovirus-related Pol polyprotein from transposon 297 [Vitis vinifera]|uniref:Retrovirus-related Pol polyprotein from transposon 297 n=1 Tax=Vitis vinifera TaxID=29760 RepID=A0A438FSN2_VITVI|nr:Retrovirus-related Pol polyprotein from transposon 297 [Vitis vinifera]
MVLNLPQDGSVLGLSADNLLLMSTKSCDLLSEDALRSGQCLEGAEGATSGLGSGEATTRATWAGALMSIRDSGGRLVKRETSHNKELELSLNIMETTPEDQHSHHGHQDNPNEFRSMRDHMHPPRMSAPSCIVPPIEQLVIRPHIVPLLQTFHGMESENPYAHIKEFEDVCNTFQEGGASIDFMRLNLFPFTLKDKAKIWLNSLRPRTKKNEKFYECWERYMEAINACPHHGFDTWLLVSYFYDGMSSSMKQLLETMCGGDFMSKNPEEAMDFLSYVVEVSRGWDEPNKGEMEKMKSQPNAFNAKVGMYTLNEDVDMKAKFAAMTRRLEELELKKIHEVQAVAETPVQVKPCSICQSYEHLVEECPTIPVAREMFGDQANVIGQFKPNKNASYGNTYNSSWRNHPNFSWKPRAPQYQQPNQPSQQVSSLEQAIVNLSKVVGDFIGDQKSINAQLSQRIDSVENTLNKRIDGMQNDLSQEIDNLQYSISRLTNLNTVQEKGRFPSQPHQNPKSIHEVETHEGESSQVKDVKALITLRSGKKVELPTPKPHVEEEEEKETKKREEIKGKKKDISEGKEDHDSTVNANPKKELIKEEMMKKHISPPFPQVCIGKRGLEMHQKSLKGLNVNKKAFLTEQVCAIIQCKSHLKYKDQGCPTISVMIGGKESNYVPIILGRPFLATSNAIINSRNGLMQLTFGNMTLELNIFYMSKKLITPEEEEGPEEVCIIDTLVEEHCDQNMQDKLNESLGDLEEGLSEPSDVVATLQVLKRCKKAIGWQISDLKGISPLVCTHHIYMEEETKPIRQPQRRLNPHLQEVVRAEVLKLAGIIYPISDSPWVSPTQVVPKKSGITVVQNENGEEIATRLTSGWRVCIDYRKLNAMTRKYHFPLPFIDQVLERVSGHPFYCFLDGYLGYFQIEIDVEDQEKTTFTCLFGTYAYRRMSFGLCNAPATFQICMLSIFSDMVE